MRSSLFWDVTQFWFVVSYRRFGTVYPPHLQGVQVLDHLTLEDVPKRRELTTNQSCVTSWKAESVKRLLYSLLLSIVSWNEGSCLRLLGPEVNFCCSVHRFWDWIRIWAIQCTVCEAKDELELSVQLLKRDMNFSCSVHSFWGWIWI
jgi:hypothetical protein